MPDSTIVQFVWLFADGRWAWPRLKEKVSGIHLGSFVPEGHSRIAQRFNAGNDAYNQPIQAPPGATETLPNRSFVPELSGVCGRTAPAMNRWAIVARPSGTKRLRRVPGAFTCTPSRQHPAKAFRSIGTQSRPFANGQPASELAQLLECAGGAKRRRRFRPPGRPSHARRSPSQSGVALRLPPHSKRFAISTAHPCSAKRLECPNVYQDRSPGQPRFQNVGITPQPPLLSLRRPLRRQRAGRERNKTGPPLRTAPTFLGPSAGRTRPGPAQCPRVGRLRQTQKG